MAGVPPRLFRALKRLLWITTDGLFASGLGASLHRNRPGERILIYHGIDDRGCLDYNTRFISQTTLEHHLKYFSQHFEVVSLHEMFAGVRSKDRLTLALTFDDGYANNLELALPLLERFGLPATFFITAGPCLGDEISWPDLIDLVTTVIDEPVEIGDESWSLNGAGKLVSADRGDSLMQRCKSSELPFISEVRSTLRPIFERLDLEALRQYWRFLDRDGIRRLAASDLVTTGCHGLHHTSLGEIEYGNAVVELEQSKQALEGVIDQPVRTLAYPDGSYTRAVVEAAAAMGFDEQLAVEFCYPEDRGDQRLRERFGVNPFMSWNNQLWCLLKGRY